MTKHPAPVPAVSDSGKMTRHEGWAPENIAWVDILAPKHPVTSKREGIDPMSLPLHTLADAGHPKRTSARAVISAMRSCSRPDPDQIKRFTQLRQYCLTDCAAGPADVRRCSIIECPIWQFRMGRNPHNPRRGQQPSFGGKNSPSHAD